MARDSDSDKSKTILDASLRLMKDSPLFGNIPIITLPGTTPEEIGNGLRKDFFFKEILA